MSLVDAVLLGVVEGITEFLPISSTGHLILVSHVLDLPSSDFLKTCEIAIQLGAILAAVFLYWRRLLFDVETMKRVVVALLPAIGVGFLFYQGIQRLLESELTVVLALGIGGLLIILFELLHHEKSDAREDLSAIPYRSAFIIGCFQALAVVPGVSRAGATILGGLLMGLRRTAIVEFSFLLAIPTMVAATGLQVFKHQAAIRGEEWLLLAVGCVTAFLVAILAIKFFLRFIATHTFISFGVYRIAIALLFFFIVL